MENLITQNLFESDTSPNNGKQITTNGKFVYADIQMSRGRFGSFYSQMKFGGLNVNGQTFFFKLATDSTAIGVFDSYYNAT